MRNLLLILRLVLLLFLLQGIALDASAREFDSSYFYSEGICYLVTGDNTVAVASNWYDGYSGNIVIPAEVRHAVRGGSGSEKNEFNFTVTSIAYGAFSGCNQLTSIELPPTIRTIGQDAFSGCTSLSNVTLSNGLDSIMASAFNGCTALQSVNIPNTVHYLGWNAFYGCAALTKVVLPNNIWELNGTFAGCSGLVSVNIPSAVISLDGTFTGCSSLQSVVLPNSVTRIGASTFRDCTSLVNVYIPNSVGEIGDYAFCNTNLSSIVMPGSVTTIGLYAFYGCSSLSSVTTRPVTPPAIASSNTFTEWIYNNAKLTVPQVAMSTYKSSDWWNLFKDITGDSSLNNSYDFTTGGLYYIVVDNSNVEVTYKDTDYGCYSGSVTIPATVTNGGKTYNVTRVGYRAFYNSTGLTKVTLPTSLTTIATEAFCGCTGLSNLTIPQNVVVIGQGAFSECSGLNQLTWNAKDCLMNGDMPTGNITKVTVGNDVETLPMGFVANSKITAVSLPGTLKLIGKNAFNDCASLSTITIPASVSNIADNAFSGCSGLTSLTWNARECWFNGDMATGNISHVNIGDEVQILPMGFARNSKITSVSIPNSVKSIGGYAFYRCDGITSITLPNGLETIGGYAFFGLNKITNVTIPLSVEAIGYSVFDGCSGLTSLTWNARECYFNGEMPTENISEVVIGNEVKVLPESFAANSKVTSITLPNSLEAIGSSAFSGCTELTEVTIPSSVTSIGDLAFYYCTGLTHIIIPNAVTSIGYSAFYGCTGLTSITIGSSVESIGYSAFSGCTSLLTVISLPVTPPSISYDTFYGVPGYMIVYVLPSALEAYQSHYYWKYYNIQSAAFNVHNLTVNLPDGADVTKYANMKLAIAKHNSDESLHYIINNKRSYTFANLDKNTTWDVTLTNQYGDEFGKIDNVEIVEEDVAVTFVSLKQPQTVTLIVKTPTGRDVTDQVSISWLDESGELIKQGKQIAGLPAGRKLAYSVKLPQELATPYSLPTDMTCTVNDGSNNVLCQLTAIAQTQLSGKVKDVSTNQPIYGASISATQTFAEGNTKTLTTRTDNQGQYLLDASSVPTTLTVAAPGYISQTMNCDMTSGSSVTLPDVALSPITGAVVNVNLTYTPAHAEGENVEIQSWYSDYQNVDYQVYNKTSGNAVTNISIQYPQIVLMENVNDGDVLELTATSRKNAFMPVKTTVTIADQKATATFNIMELGQVTATFNKNINPKVTGTLYDAEDKLVKTADYSGSTLSLEELADGDYKLITMGKSEFFNSIYDLDQLSAVGLQAGTDYAENTVNVESGLISKVNIDEVPYFDESKFYYTGEHTSFTVNKPNIVIGNYLTFRAQVNFKEQYANKVRNVQLIIDLPESCQLYENSVMVGISTSNYTVNGSRISIPLANYNDLVRFCAIPTEIGDFAPSAFVQFKLNGKTITQPIGSAPFKADGLSINVPSKVAGTRVLIQGNAIGVCGIDIFDNDVLIGHTTSLANGTWSTKCELYEAYNLSSHNIYAIATTNNGFMLRTETATCLYDKDYIMVDNVAMLYNNPEVGPYNIVFDFINGAVSPTSYYFFPYKSWPNWSGSGTEPKIFTFVINFTNNDPEIVSNVIINVFTERNDVHRLTAFYNSANDEWAAVSLFGDDNLPINVSVSYISKSQALTENKSAAGELKTISIKNATDDDIPAPPCPPIQPFRDPSGFVYEGVPSNRLQGVTATCYYKEMVEDIYGDPVENVMLWDAEQYGQENPLLTDENGFYRWDVPIGMWQVKYEKEGYETTYSDWLPVPPPQLDVNIGMVQMRQPEVIKARAYPKAVEFEFDKYMLPEDLTTQNITVLNDYGEAVTGTIELLNAELDDPLAITSIRRAPGTGLTFASKVRFNSNSRFYQKATLKVRKAVKSYAGLEMSEYYVVTLPVEYEMEEIVADSTIIIPYGDSRELTVKVQPSYAASGKTLTVRSTSSMIATTDAEQYMLDNNGRAVITVHGGLPGTTSLLYSIDGYDMTAVTFVNVMMENQMTVAAPTASIASGSEVEKGTALYLKCATEGATIYYTLDGSCPCDNTPARKVYDGDPIIINGTTTIKAMATAPDLYDSDVATFVYRVNDDIRGDVNNDGEVNIADINAVISIILGKPVDPDYLNRADVNRDDEINISDINEIIKIILYGSNKISMKVNCNDRLHLNDVEMKPGEVRTLNVTLDNSLSYSALQCDIELPAGLTLVDIRAANGEMTKMGVVNDSTTRIMAYSMNGYRLANNGQAVLAITVRADNALGAESQIVLKNSVVADKNDKAWHVANCAAKVNNATGIDDLTAGNDRVWVDGNIVCLFSHQSGTARLVGVNGVQQVLNINAGLTRHEVAAGVYVIVLNDNSYKVVVK